MAASGAAIDTAFGILNGSVSGLINNAFYARNLRLQEETQKRLIDYQNAYNSPASQMQRLAEAGLNPNLVYGSQAPAGMSGNASSPSGVANPGNYNTSDVVNSMLHIQQMKQQDAAIENMNAETRLKNAEAVEREIWNAKAPELANKALEQAQKNLEKTAQDIEVGKSTVVYQKAQAKLADADEAFKRGEITLQTYRQNVLVAQTELFRQEALTKESERHLNYTRNYYEDIDGQMKILELEYKRLFMSNGRMREMAKAEYNAAVEQWKKIAKASAARIGIDGSKTVQWINWAFDKYTTMLGGAKSAAATTQSASNIKI